MSAPTRERLDTFWELIDEILNAVLFVLIGLEILAIKFSLTKPPGSAAPAQMRNKGFYDDVALVGRAAWQAWARRL